MIPRESLDALRGALGEHAVVSHDPIEVDGVALAATVRPADGEALGLALTSLGRCGLGALVRGAGSGLALGNPPTRARVVLSTEAIAGIDELDAGEGVCRARAGTPVARLRAAAAEQGWELPLDPPGASGTLGGALASAAVGPRSLGLGPPRDAVLGLEVALASGERTHCGGRVVKNVTGYDLNKLYTGSLGSLGVIEAAWLRLRPAPGRALVFAGEVAADGEGYRRGLAAARRATARASTLARAPGAPACRLVVELAGDPESVEIDADWLRREQGLASASGAELDRVRQRQAEMPGSGGLRLRLAATPTRAGSAFAALVPTGAELLAHPGLGLVYAGFRLAAEADAGGDPAGRAIDTFARHAREAGGSWLIEAAPAAAKAHRDVFGDPAPALAIARALKQQFDPDGLLNAGRFAGHL